MNKLLSVRLAVSTSYRACQFPIRTLLIIVAQIGALSAMAQGLASSEPTPLERDPQAITVLTQALAALEPPGTAEHGFHLTGQIISATPSAPVETFAANSFRDGYTMDVTSGGTQFHSELKAGSLTRAKNQATIKRTASDLWTPRLDFFPLHGWWIYFEAQTAQVTLLAPEPIDGEPCQHVRVVLPPPPPLDSTPNMHRVEDVFVGNSTRLIRLIRYQIPTDQEFLHPVTVEVHYAQFQSFGAIQVATLVTRKVRGLMASTFQLTAITPLNTASVSTQ
jgi:hypothetical protein